MAQVDHHTCARARCRASWTPRPASLQDRLETLAEKHQSTKKAPKQEEDGKQATSRSATQKRSTQQNTRPSDAEVQTVFKAMARIQQTNASFGGRVVLRALLGWLDTASTAQEVVRGANGFALTARCCSAAALDQATRVLLGRPSGTLADLERASATDWSMTRELVLSGMLVDRMGATGLKDATLRRFADPRVACSRAEWEAAFGIRLPRKRRWRRFGSASPVAELRRTVAAAGGSIASLPLRQVLTLAQPTDTIGEGWFSPAAYFVQNMLHFAEVLTSESVLALAHYLRSRQQALGSTRPIVEVGAGLGRLAHLLNATGVFDGAVIATDPQPDDQCEPHNVLFPLEQLDAAATLLKYKPDIVLCAWMEFGADFSRDLRDARVAEYVLIGEAGRRGAPRQTAQSYRVLGSDGHSHHMTYDEHVAQMGTLCYSLNLPPEKHHPGYHRVLLPEVSAELLHIHDLQDAEEGLEDAEGILVAVAFRRA